MIKFQTRPKQSVHNLLNYWVFPNVVIFLASDVNQSKKAQQAQLAKTLIKRFGYMLCIVSRFKQNKSSVHIFK